MEWDNERCQCVEKNNVTDHNKAYNDCVEREQNGEIDSSDRALCMMDNAMMAGGLSNCGGFLEETEDGKKLNESDTSDSEQCMDSIGATGINNASVAEQWQNRLAMINMLLSIIMWIGHSGKSKDNGTCASTVWMTAASVAGVANELINYFWFESRLRDLQVEFYEKVLCDTSLSQASDSYASTSSSENETDVSGGCANQDPFETQTTAFSFLYDERVISSEVHTKKSIGYGVLAVLYVIAIAAAATQMAATYGGSSNVPSVIRKSAPNPTPTWFEPPDLKKFNLMNIGKALISLITDALLVEKVIGETRRTYQNNLTGSNLTGLEQFFKVKRYTCNHSDPDYGDCMRCMKSTVSKGDSSDSDDDELDTGEPAEVDCSKYEKYDRL